MARRKRKKKKVEEAPKINIGGVTVYVNNLFKDKKYDIDVKHLWDENYRVNCYQNGAMVRSHFIRYNDSGILEAYPDLNTIGF